MWPTRVAECRERPWRVRGRRGPDRPRDDRAPGRSGKEARPLTTRPFSSTGRSTILPPTTEATWTMSESIDPSSVDGKFEVRRATESPKKIAPAMIASETIAPKIERRGFPAVFTGYNSNQCDHANSAAETPIDAQTKSWNGRTRARPVATNTMRARLRRRLRKAPKTSTRENRRRTGRRRARRECRSRLGTIPAEWRKGSAPCVASPC